MPTVTVLPNASVVHRALGPASGGKPPLRTQIAGWSSGAARRNERFLQSVYVDALDGYGYSATFTVRDCPPDSLAWHTARRSLVKRLERVGLVRLHWLVELQARGVPHLHLACYFSAPVDPGALRDAWLDIAGRWGARSSGQHVEPLTGPKGWLKYLAKHGARGVHHYQRQGMPPGWTSTGRLWGYTGSWPVEREPLVYDLPPAAWYRYRRLLRAWCVAEARIVPVGRSSTRGRQIGWARRMLRCPDRVLSPCRGMARWVPLGAQLDLLALLADEGYEVFQRLSDGALVTTAGLLDADTGQLRSFDDHDNWVTGPVP